MPGQTFEELVTKVASLSDELATIKEAAKSGTDDNDKDDKMEAFLKAKAEMDDEHKEATDDSDEIEKVREAFKKAAEETDDDKKHEAMKKAEEMKEEHDSKKARKAKKGQDEPAPKENVEKEATKIANLEKEIALPTINKILQAEQLVNPDNVKNLEKRLRTASLKDIKQMWTERQPYVAALGVTATPDNTQPTFIPFQAGITGEGVEETDFAKMDSEKLLSEMYR